VLFVSFVDSKALTMMPEKKQLPKGNTKKLRSPVRREEAPRYLLVTLIAFAASITLTRLFLQLTGYPRLGFGSLHIAHVLWGGLLLFLASLLPLILVNRWALSASALLAGAGAGLFLDEVGKFITSTNDYFYPPAAPIVYVFFLLTVWVYAQFSRPPARDPRTSFYRVLDGLEEVLDQDLDDEERSDLTARLHMIHGQDRDPAIVNLAGALLKFLESDSVILTPPQPTLLRRIQTSIAAFESRRITQNDLRIALSGGLAALGGIQVAGLIRLVAAVPAPERLGAILTGWILESHVGSLTAVYWYSARLALEAAAGMILILGGVLLILKKIKMGVMLGVIGLMFSIVAVNPLVFYFDQFSTILPATIHFLWLLLLLHYQRKNNA
jgi:hypothetical protein